MLLLQLKFNVHLPHVMEGSAVSSSPSHCVIHSTEWLNSWSFTGWFAGASLADSCDNERANVHRNTSCVWGHSFSQSHRYPKGRYVLWCRYTVFHVSFSARGLLDVCFDLRSYPFRPYSNTNYFHDFHINFILPSLS